HLKDALALGSRRSVLDRHECSIMVVAPELKGRAGAAIAARTALESIDLEGVRRGLPGLSAAPHTGPWLETELEDPLGDGRALTVISCYMHSGNTEKPQTMTDKYEFLDVMKIGRAHV